MKTLILSDEDHASLMEFSMELQTQENHSQAFPYFWEPASGKLVNNPNNEGDVKEVFDEDSGGTIPIAEYAESNPDLYKGFLADQGYIIEDSPDYEYLESLENEWFEYIEIYGNDIRVYSSDWEQQSEHNPSLFLSDVKAHIKANSHNLGRNPRTYARTIHRMPKMASLIEIIYRLNPQPSEDINHEARRFVPKNKKES